MNAHQYTGEVCGYCGALLTTDDAQSSSPRTCAKCRCEADREWLERTDNLSGNNKTKPMNIEAKLTEERERERRLMKICDEAEAVAKPYVQKYEAARREWHESYKRVKSLEMLVKMEQESEPAAAREEKATA